MANGFAFWHTDLFMYQLHEQVRGLVVWEIGARLIVGLSDWAWMDLIVH